MEPGKRNPIRLVIESLDERAMPAHLNPGVGVVVLPAAADHGAHGIATAMAAPADHHRAAISTAQGKEA
jgi:hypothetical protein